MLTGLLSAPITELIPGIDALRWKEHLRERSEQRYKSTRLWTENPDDLGMCGELVTAGYFRAMPDLRNRPKGDGGIDLIVLLKFYHSRWFETDTKASSDPGYLLVNSQKLIPPSRIYIHVSGRPLECLGWEWGMNVMSYPTEWWKGNDALVHVVPAELLHPMHELGDIYQGWWQHCGLRPRPAL